MELFNLPNSLTLLRILLVPVFTYLFLIHEYRIALIVFMVTGCTDVVDGYLARKLHKKTTLGSILDPAADKLLMFVTFIVLAIQKIVPVWHDRIAKRRIGQWANIRPLVAGGGELKVAIGAGIYPWRFRIRAIHIHRATVQQCGSRGRAICRGSSAARDVGRDDLWQCHIGRHPPQGHLLDLLKGQTEDFDKSDSPEIDIFDLYPALRDKVKQTALKEYGQDQEPIVCERVD